MAENTGKEIILITGATNGIGLDTVVYIASASPKYHVIIGARNPSKGETVLKSVQAKPGIQGTVSLVHIDATDDSSILAAAETVEKEFGHLDVLINNAGICPERDGKWPDRETLRVTFDTNVAGPAIISTTFLPLLKKSSNPRIINVTSELGSMGAISDHSEWMSSVQYPGYRISKAALNMLTAYQWYQLKPEGFKIWTYCPGYVATDLINDRERRVEQGVESSETSAKGLLEIVQGDRDADVGTFIGKYGRKHQWQAAAVETEVFLTLEYMAWQVQMGLLGIIPSAQLPLLDPIDV